MGKKKNKFKKSHRIEAPVMRVKTTVSTVDTKEDEILDEGISEKAVEAKPDHLTDLNRQYKYVRKDVRKLLMTIGLLVVLFVAAYFVNQQTGLLTSIGNWIYKIGNFQI